MGTLALENRTYGNMIRTVGEGADQESGRPEHCFPIAFLAVTEIALGPGIVDAVSRTSSGIRTRSHVRLQSDL